MSCGPAWRAGSRTRPPAASYAAACRSAWSGARPTGRSASTPMRRSPACSPPCSGSSLSAGRCAPPGCGCAPSSLRWPLQQAVYLHGKPGEITWVEPTYHAVHTTLTHPAYAGAYVYGRTRDERYLGPDGALRTRRRMLPRDQWEVLIPDHHPGFTDWDTYLANQAPHRHQHPPAGPPAGHRRGPGRLRAAAGPGHLRHLRPQAGHLLPRTGQDRAELLLPGLCRAGRRPRRPAHERRRAGHRRRRRRGVPGRPPAGRAARLPARRRADRARPRRGAGSAPPPGRAGPL